nr:hypothetical protein [uncultured bacterium]
MAGRRRLAWRRRLARRHPGMAGRRRLAWRRRLARRPARMAGWRRLARPWRRRLRFKPRLTAVRTLASWTSRTRLIGYHLRHQTSDASPISVGRLLFGRPPLQDRSMGRRLRAGGDFRRSPIRAARRKAAGAGRPVAAASVSRSRSSWRRARRSRRGCVCASPPDSARRK